MGLVSAGLVSAGLASAGLVSAGLASVGLISVGLASRRLPLSRPGGSSLPSAARCILRRRQRASLVSFAELELLHLFFYKKEVALGQKVQVPLERHVPVFGRPALDVVQTGREKVSIHVLVALQDDFGLYLDLIGPLGPSFLLPNLF
ncbi:MAG: hypothetical protein BZY81_00125 [SAR202 cluster bacterium Io17-Chloro-G4]|nr:MAG: hypothetical protein BZY81_00125 [SAR202 cluster bacterium Io17-Chloro-G4]